MKHIKKVLLLVLVLALALVGSMSVLGQDDSPDPIESVCLITDVGRVNDGTFNEFAYAGMLDAVDEFDLDSDFIETESETDYDSNINTCVDEGFEAIVTVGFLIQDATVEAARTNPDVFFIGIDQDASGVEDAPENFVGVQFREDQSGFLAGVLAALWANENDEEVIAGVYGIDVPAVKRFRNGYEQGALYVNPEWERGTNILGNYESSFVDPTVGISAANQYIGEGAFVVFGAGGPMGSAGIQEAASQGVWVIGVDQDEYFTTFGEGSTEGAEFLMSSAIKRVDQGVFDMLAALAEGEFEDFPGGTNYLLDAEANGVGLAPKHEADVPDELYEQADEVRQMLIDGDISTGVDPVSGDLMDEMDMEATEEAMEDDMDDEEPEPEATEEGDS